MNVIEEEGCYQSQLRVQELNHSASILMYDGEYDQAIVLLKEGLELAGRSLLLEPENNTVPRSFCSFQFSSSPSSSSSSHFDSQYPQDLNLEEELLLEADGGFVCRRAILINKEDIEEKQYKSMGFKLSVSIIFNLALAHHLEAISSTNRNLPVLWKALKLYELAYQLHTQGMQQSLSSSSIPSSPSLSPSLSPSFLLSSNNNNMDHEDEIIVSSITNSSLGMLQFTMIITNNIGEIHRVVGNQEEHDNLFDYYYYLVKCNIY
jgi:hypothetical protein